MKISREGLASHISRALEAYANQVQNGFNLKVWLPFTEGAEYIDVRVTLTDGGIIFQPIVQETPKIEPVLLVEPQVPQSQEDIDINSVPVEEEPKTKRKRKTE